MIKAVLFDVGGVILDMKPLMEQFVGIFHPDKKEELWDTLNIKSAPLCRGEMSELDFWREVAKKLNRNIPDDILKDLWIHDYEKLTSVTEEILPVIDSLRGVYKLAIVSNTIESHTIINRKRGVFERFDEVILSYEVKMSKERPDIFLLAAERLKTIPSECVFIDDVKQFADTAESAGMKAICFKSTGQIKMELEKLGVKV